MSNFKVGDRVVTTVKEESRNVWPGPGTIMSIEEEFIYIHFDGDDPDEWYYFHDHELRKVEN